MYEPQITHQPGVEASYYGISQVRGVDKANERIDAYDVVWVSGQYAKEVNYHEYAKKKDGRPFYMDGAYIEDSETVEQWDTYSAEGNLDALLCEAEYVTHCFMDSAELKYVSHKPAGAKYTCTVTANFKAVVTKTPTISIRVEFTDGCSSSQTTTMRSYRVMYKVTDGPTTAAKTYTVKGFVQGSTNAQYSMDVTVPKGANNTTEQQLYSGTAGFPSGYTCGEQYMTVTAK